MKFLEPTRKPKVIYTDNSLEFGKSCGELSWNHCTWTPHRSETSGIAETAVRRVKEVTSAVLLQSGLDQEWWANSMECYCYLRNIEDLLSDGKDTIWNAVRNAFWRTSNTVWSNGRISPYLCEGHIEITSILSKSLTRYISRLCIVCGENLERRHFGRRHWRIGADGRIWNPRQKAQCKGGVNDNEWWKVHIPIRRCFPWVRWRRSGSENTHLEPGPPRQRKRPR